MKFDLLRIIGIPIIFAILNVFFRILGRHNNDESDLRNSYAICTSLLLLALSKTSSDIYTSIKIDSPNTNIFFLWTGAFLLILTFSAVWDRFYSWEPGTNNKDLKKGIIYPDIIALIAFVSYQIRAASLLK